MKRLPLLIVASFFYASPVYAVPLTWIFSGTTTPSSEHKGMQVGGLDAEFRIFLDTDLVAVPESLLGNDIIFGGPFQGQIDLETFGILPVFPIDVVENFAPSQGGVQGVEITQSGPSGKTFVNFSTIISNDRAHLTPISPTSQLTDVNTLLVGGPNDLLLSLEVKTFSATTAVPEGGSTALFLAPALTALCFLRRRYAAYTF